MNLKNNRIIIFCLKIKSQCRQDFQMKLLPFPLNARYVLCSAVFCCVLCNVCVQHMQASQQATPFTTLVRPAYVDNRVCEERERAF